jgi:hypothetical protein
VLYVRIAFIFLIKLILIAYCCNMNKKGGYFMSVESDGNIGSRAPNTQPVGTQKINPTSNANKDANAGASTLTAMMQGSTKVTASFTDTNAFASPSTAPPVSSALKATDTLASGNKAQANQLYSGGNPQGGGMVEGNSGYTKD